MILFIKFNWPHWKLDQSIKLRNDILNGDVFHSNLSDWSDPVCKAKIYITLSWVWDHYDRPTPQQRRTSLNFILLTCIVCPDTWPIKTTMITISYKLTPAFIRTSSTSNTLRQVIKIHSQDSQSPAETSLEKLGWPIQTIQRGYQHWLLCSDALKDS